MENPGRKTIVILAALMTAFLFLTQVPLNAQIGISTETDHTNYLHYEAVLLKLHIRNFSGHVLAFNENTTPQNHLFLELTDEKGMLIPLKKGKKPDLLGLIIPPGASKDTTIPILYYYNLPPGKYKITAYIKHPQLTSSYASQSQDFTISTGVTVWQRMVGIPDLINKNPEGIPIPSRTYKIISLFDGKNKLFYLVIEDKSFVYSVKRIGYEMAAKVPECEIDNFSRIHIIQQLSSTVAVYLLYDTNGTLEDRAVYRKTTVMPTLLRNQENGSVSVSGGEKVEKIQDYLEDQTEPFANKKEDSDKSE